MIKSVGKHKLVRWLFSKIWEHRLADSWRGKPDIVLCVLGWKTARIVSPTGQVQCVSFVVEVGPLTLD